MNIKVGRAALFINSSTYTTAARGPSEKNLNINVWQGALSGLLTSSVLALTAASLLAF